MPFLRNMKLYLTAILLLLTLALNAQSLNFRTDGYYFQDNGIDTLFLIRMNTPGSKVMISELAKSGINANGGDKCIPAGTVPKGPNSSLMHIISFFSNSFGTTFDEACWNDVIYKNVVKTIKERKANTNKETFSQLVNDQREESH